MAESDGGRSREVLPERAFWRGPKHQHIDEEEEDQHSGNNE